MHFNTKDLTGQKFWKLTVIKMSEERGNRNQIKWICKCECGNIHIVTGESLRAGKSKSCGCLKHKDSYNKIQDREFALWKQLYNSTIKRRNKNKGFEENIISLQDFIKLSQEVCFYCGEYPQSILKDVNKVYRNKLVSNTQIKFNGIDRIDSQKGYIKGNVVNCCKKCNTAKNTMTTEEFKQWIKKVYMYYCK